MSDWTHGDDFEQELLRERIANQDDAVRTFFEWGRLERDHPWFRSLTLTAQFMVASEILNAGIEVPDDADIRFFRCIARRVVDAHVAWGVEK